MGDWDITTIRSRFPALRRPGPDGSPVAWLDGPAGTQVVDTCQRAINDYLLTSNANLGGAFAASRETDALIHDVRAAVADFLGATDAEEVSFGPNMTTITFALSRAIGATLQRGDAIVVTRLDHDANVAPWLAMAEERGLEVRWVGIHEDDCGLELADLERALEGRARLVAVGLASNAVGTINPLPRISTLVHAAGARLWVDAVHAAPHLSLDVGELGADYLVCSAYKFYGPHVGLLWGRRELLEALPPYHVRPAGDAIPGRFETGTQPHELLAGLGGTIAYLEKVGVTEGGAPGLPGGADGLRRARLLAAMSAVRRYESRLAARLIERVMAVRGLRVRGIIDPSRSAERCPTIAFTIEGHHPRDIARHLADRGIHSWDGDYYAWELIRALGLAERGGMLRVGLVHYNTDAEIERLGDALDELVGA
ncbi:MAG TPA: cysteine desulfurase-like protein [Candidatus Limnocylindrales bacterium]|nr:cysteine desulfurase-like protein [Candidatus Limnocylindrales bacterium]